MDSRLHVLEFIGPVFMDVEVEQPITKGDRFRYAQVKSGKSVAQIAGDIGVTPKAIYKWFKGGNVEDEQLVRYSLATGINTRWLVFGDGPKRIKENTILDEIERANLLPAQKEEIKRAALDFARFRIRDLETNG